MSSSTTSRAGRVDYGEAHSAACGHGRFGRAYDRGHYPLWDEAHPAHFVGHSAGAQVVRLLQQMLHDGAFPGHAATSERWVLSVTSLSGALNGSTRAYIDGARVEDGGRSLRPVCLLQICRVGSVLYHWLDLPPWLKRYYDFGFDHFGMSRRLVGARGLADALVAGRRGLFATGDWIVPDLTIQGAARINARVRTFPGTFYFSYASRVPSGLLGIHPLLFLRALQMRRWRWPAGAPPPYEGYRDEDWEDNDGALNTFSMTHPRVPEEHSSEPVEEEEEDGARCGPASGTTGSWRRTTWHSSSIAAAGACSSTSSTTASSATAGVCACRTAPPPTQLRKQS